MEHVAQLIAVADARPLDAQESLVQSQSPVECEPVDVRGRVRPRCVVSRTCGDAPHEHQVGPELRATRQVVRVCKRDTVHETRYAAFLNSFATYLNQIFDVLCRHRLVAEVVLADGVGTLRRLVPVRNVQVIRDDAREVGLELCQQFWVDFETYIVVGGKWPEGMMSTVIELQDC